MGDNSAFKGLTLFLIFRSPCPYLEYSFDVGRSVHHHTIQTN